MAAATITTLKTGSLQPAAPRSGRNCVAAASVQRRCYRRIAAEAVRGGRPQLLPPPEDKLLNCLLETGIRGSLAMLGASALGVDVWSHCWGLQHLGTGLQMAAPVAAADGALLLLLLKQQQQKQQPATEDGSDGAPAAPASMTAAATAAAAAAEAVQLHNIRYSLAGAASGGRRLLLEAGAQLSEELLVRGVMLGAASTWLTSRMIEAGVCETAPMLGGAAASSDGVGLPSCAAGAQWLAAAGLCAAMASRFVVYGRDKAVAARGQREAAGTEASTRRALLRYEPLAVQQRAAAAAASTDAASGSSGSGTDAAAGDWGADGSVRELAHTWLGARYVAGQAALFAAFIVSGSLAASLTAGVAMQLASGACAERYLTAQESSKGDGPPQA